MSQHKIQIPYAHLLVPIFVIPALLFINALLKEGGSQLASSSIEEPPPPPPPPPTLAAPKPPAPSGSSVDDRPAALTLDDNGQCVETAATQQQQRRRSPPPTLIRCHTGVGSMDGPLVDCSTNQCLNTTSADATTVYSCDYGQICEVLGLRDECVREDDEGTTVCCCSTNECNFGVGATAPRSIGSSQRRRRSSSSSSDAVLAVAANFIVDDDHHPSALEGAPHHTQEQQGWRRAGDAPYRPRIVSDAHSSRIEL